MSNKILYISQEITPYMTATPMAVTGQKLPQRAQEKGYEVRLFMPKYGCINERRNQLHEVIRLSGMNVVIDDTDHPLIIKVATLQPSRMQVYFIDSDDYFIHKPIADTELALYPAENDERLIFFSYGVIETVKKLRWEPRIIHLQGWISSLIPAYLKLLYADDPMFKDAKIFYNIYDSSFDGTLDKRLIDKLKEAGLPGSVTDRIPAEGATATDLMKIAIDYSDVIVVPSTNASDELIDYARQQGKAIVTDIDNSDYTATIEAYNE